MSFKSIGTLVSKAFAPSGLKRLMSIEGDLSEAEASELMLLAQQVPKGAVIVEIGSFRGRSTVALALGAMKGHENVVYAVDPHLQCVGIYGRRFGPEDQVAFYRNLVRYGVGRIVKVIGLPSVQAATCWPERNIGLLWIDGDHRAEAVRADLGAWYPHLLEIGVVAFHDSHGEGVQSAIHLASESKGLLVKGAVDTLTWLSRSNANTIQSALA
jgi:predicted O-methyltransferase YrrM